MAMIQAGKPDNNEWLALQRLIAFAKPALDEAARQATSVPASVSLCYWASPLVLDVRHHQDDGRAKKFHLFVTNPIVGEALAAFLTAGVNRLPSRERLTAIVLSSRPGVSLALEIDLTFGGAAGVVLTLDERQRVELFQLTELPH